MQVSFGVFALETTVTIPTKITLFHLTIKGAGTVLLPDKIIGGATSTSCSPIFSVT